MKSTLQIIDVLCGLHSINSTQLAQIIDLSNEEQKRLEKGVVSITILDRIATIFGINSAKLYYIINKNITDKQQTYMSLILEILKIRENNTIKIHEHFKFNISNWEKFKKHVGLSQLEAMTIELMHGFYDNKTKKYDQIKEYLVDKGYDEHIITINALKSYYNSSIEKIALYIESKRNSNKPNIVIYKPTVETFNKRNYAKVKFSNIGCETKKEVLEAILDLPVEYQAIATEYYVLNKTKERIFNENNYGKDVFDRIMKDIKTALKEITKKKKDEQAILDIYNSTMSKTNFKSTKIDIHPNIEINCFNGLSDNGYNISQKKSL